MKTLQKGVMVALALGLTLWAIEGYSVVYAEDVIACPGAPKWCRIFWCC